MPRMPPPATESARRRVRRRDQRAAQRATRFAGLAVLGCVFVVTLALTAFGSSRPAAVRSVPAPAQRLLPTGPPGPVVVASQGDLRLQLPIARSRVTAIGYHGSGNGALALQPLGRQGNEGLLARLAHRIFGEASGGLVYYQLGGGAGPATSVLDVGAAPGTDVYAPVDGTVVGITDYVVSARPYGVRVDVQPSSAPSVILSITHLRLDPSLSVGSLLTAGGSKLGTLLDLSRVERQTLARYTQDAGNHVSLEVLPAATSALP